MYAFIRIFKVLALICVSLKCFSSATAFVPPVHQLLQRDIQQKNLILVLDVKQQEDYLGACGFTLAAALQDKIAPIIASEHALAFVQRYFNPSEWEIYKKGTLVLFIPNKSVAGYYHKSRNNSEFELDGWQRKNVPYNKMLVSDLYKSLDCVPLYHEELDQHMFADLSKQSTDIICSTLKKDKSYSWKVYAVGHGAPNACQVCGLNLKDFQQLLSVLNKEYAIEFLIYETCFGGGKNQLREVYKEAQSSFKTFNFPIISCCITNSVSFSPSPDYYKLSFKGLFNKINNSTILEKKMHKLLKAVNEFNKCLEFASEFHWSNNLLLVRMPGSQFFEPVADNRRVFKLSEVPALTDQEKRYVTSKEFKCILIDKPVLKQSVDLSMFENFMVASGISRSKQYVQQLKLPAAKNFWGSEISNPIEVLQNVASQFSSLAFPQKQKYVYVDCLNMGSAVFENVTISLVPTGFWGYCAKVNIDAQHNGDFYTGCVQIDLQNPKNQEVLIRKGSDYELSSYITWYTDAVKKHINKKHPLPCCFSFQMF